MIRKNKPNKGWFKKGHKAWAKGRIFTKEHRKHLSEALMGRTAWNKGKTGIYRLETIERIKKKLTGRKLSKEHKKKIIEYMKKYRNGENNPNWKGGKSFEPYTPEFTEKLKMRIRKRDNYICQICNRYGNAIHHIDYDKTNCDFNNLITLCKSCNSKVNSKRNYWNNYLKEICQKKIILVG